MDDEERQAKADKLAEDLKRANEEFIRDTPGVHPIGKAAPDGKYGHPFHDKVAAYINDANSNAKLKSAFMEGFYSQQHDKALAYLRSAGIINANTPTARINEFLAAWNIPPLPGQESDDVTIDVGEAIRIAEHESGGPVDVGEATITPEPEPLFPHQKVGYDSYISKVSANLDDEIVDAEVIEDQ